MFLKMIKLFDMHYNIPSTMKNQVRSYNIKKGSYEPRRQQSLPRLDAAKREITGRKTASSDSGSLICRIYSMFLAGREPYMCLKTRYVEHVHA
jgi:hypothetical protein